MPSVMLSGAVGFAFSHRFLCGMWLSGFSTHRKISGSIPDSSSLHVKVPLGKILNPRLLLMTFPLVCEC